MTPLRFLQSLVLACSILALLEPRPARAEDPITPPTEIDNSRFQFEGRVIGNSVYIRSGPSENDYPTLKLNDGQTVTVVGIKFEWLKIVPPEGSFCYVAKAYVEKRGDGSVGRVNTQLNVRVGSALNAMKTKISAKLDPGADVAIIGDQDE